MSPTGFVFPTNNAGPPPGIPYGHCFRKHTTPGACDFRNVPLINAMMNPTVEVAQFCAGTNTWRDQQFGALSSQQCISPEVRSAPCPALWPTGTTPTSGMLGIVVGDWTNNAVYPYTERLSLYWGCIAYNDPTLPPPPMLTGDFATGVAASDVAAQNPYDVELFPYVLGSCCAPARNMQDLQNSTPGLQWGGTFVATVVVGITF